MASLVTGGGGFLGHYIVEQLLAQGESVRVFCRGMYPTLEALDVEIVRGDLRDPTMVRTACANMDTVYHVAALPGVWGKWDTYHSINTLGTRHVLQACQREHVQKLIYTSSPSVVFDGQPHVNATEALPYPDRYLCHYPHTKAIAEKEVLSAHDPAGLWTCALRPHLVWGPRDNHLIPRLLQKTASGRLRRVGSGDNLISMTYVENAAAAHLQAAEKLSATSSVGGSAYFINEPEPVNLWDWINEIVTGAGLRPIEKCIPARAAYSVGAALETAWRITGRQSEPPMTRFLALQLSQTHTYSICKAEQDFGFRPIVDYPTAWQKLLADIPRMLHQCG